MSDQVTTIELRFIDLPQFQEAAARLLDVRDEARLLYPNSGLAERIEEAIAVWFGAEG